MSRKLNALFDKLKERSKGLRQLLGWVDAILFAVVVVSFINIFFLQAFKIPSSSMESSLMTGDHLFVSKIAYGPKLPQTPLSVPFIHNVMPFSGKDSFSTRLQYGYRRLKGFGKVERDDYVVFSFPHGDTVLVKAPAEDYHTHVRFSSREQVIASMGPVKVRPVDKKDHYVKRCVAVAGDTLQLIDGWVYVNGKPQTRYGGIQNTYRVTTDGSGINALIFRNLDISESDQWFSSSVPGYPAVPLTDKALEKVRSLSNVVSVDQNIDNFPPDYPDSELMLFPFVRTGWTRDNYGPIWIPAKGETVELNPGNISLYRRIIEVYEGNSFEIAADGSFIINGQPATEYTFKMDYYFMMGDNRHNSLDSRYWGFVPEDHIVGKPCVIWLSTDSRKSFPSNIRWKRLMKFV